MIKFIKNLFKGKKQQCNLPVVRRSNIITCIGDEYQCKRAYNNLVDREEIHITSVSITRVDHDGGRGYVNHFMIAVSYDYDYYA